MQSPSSPLAVPTARQARSGSLLGNMSVGQKLLLSGVLLGIPAAGLAINNVIQQQKELSQIQNELRGQRMLAPATELLLSTQSARLYATRVLQQSTSAQKQLSESQQAINAALAKLTQQSQNAGYAELTDALQEARGRFTLLNKRIDGRAIAPSEAQREYSQLLENDVVPLFEEIADVSDMKQASSLITAELMYLVTSAYPQNASTAESVFSGNLPLLEQIGKGNPIDSASRRDAQFRYDTYLTAHERILESYDHIMLLSPELKEAMQPSYNRFKTVGDRVFGTLNKNVLQAYYLGISPDELAAYAPQYTAGLAGGLKALNQAYGSVLADTEANLRRQTLVTALTTLLGLAVAFGLLYLITRAITNPIRRLTNAAQRMSSGDFNVQVPVTTADEVGLLSNTFNSAASQLRTNAERDALERRQAQALQQNVGEFLDVTMDIAEGDLTRRGKVTEDVLGNVVDSINLMTEELAGTLKQVQNASQSVTNGSQQMLGTTEQIQQGAQLTAAEAQRVAEQVEQITAAIRQMAENAQQSAETARQALIASQEGQQAVQETLGGMQNIRREVQQVTQRVKSLGERSQEIQEVVDTISQIARRTNLLALNASVEAAGAGEAGGRFSAVAEEIRQLAATSAQATTRVATLIRNVQVEVQDVAVGAAEGTREVEQGYRIAGTAGERLEQIGKLTEQSAQLAERIAESTQQQVNGVESVSANVQQIANVAQQSQQAVEQGRGAAQKLQELAQQLNASLARFRLPS